MHYRNRIKCPKYRMNNGLSTVEITISTLNSWEFLDILLCLGNTHTHTNITAYIQTQTNRNTKTTNKHTHTYQVDKKTHAQTIRFLSRCCILSGWCTIKCTTHRYRYLKHLIRNKKKNNINNINKNKNNNNHNDNDNKISKQI